MRRELIPGSGDAATARLARSAKFLAGEFRRDGKCKRVEALAGRTQRCARVNNPPLPAKPRKTSAPPEPRASWSVSSLSVAGRQSDCVIYETYLLG